MSDPQFDDLQAVTRDQLAAYTWSFTDQEYADFMRWTEHFPGLAGLRGEGRDRSMPLTEGSLGPHSVRALRAIAEIARPRSILEIGFNCGYSAACWLNICPDAKLVSVDISTRDRTMWGAAWLSSWFHDRFRLVLADSKFCGPTLPGRDYDLIFIDGDHSERGIRADVGLAMELRIPFVAFDDWWPIFGETQAAVRDIAALECVGHWGNIALFRNREARRDDASGVTPTRPAGNKQEMASAK